MREDEINIYWNVHENTGTRSGCCGEELECERGRDLGVVSMELQRFSILQGD
jgi:hypothetical protein